MLHLAILRAMFFIQEVNRLLLALVYSFIVYFTFNLLKHVWEWWHHHVPPEVEECELPISTLSGANPHAQSATYSQGSSSTEKELSNKNLFDIGKKLRDAFKHQAMPSSKNESGKKLRDAFEHQAMPSSENEPAQKQFAVLYLFSSKAEVLKLEFETGSENNGLTNNRKPSFPRDAKLYNYVTARPNDNHAEMIIMKKFDKLVKAYGKSHSEDPIKYIILYTWLFPCEDCVSAIVSEMRRAYPKDSSKVFIFVLYSDPYREDENEKSNTKQTFKLNKIHPKRIFEARLVLK